MDDKNMVIFNDVNNKNITLIRDIETIFQKHEWDCGVSCLIGILKWLKKFNTDQISNESDIINQMLNTKSIWSIDISTVLCKLSVKHVYYTNTIGVCIDHHEKEYYKNNWESDSLRVNNLFLQTMNLNPSNLKLVSSPSQLPIKYYIDHISKGFPIILLVDSSHLYCNICKVNHISRIDYKSKEDEEEKEKDKENENIKRFCGHYIILVGYNYETKELIYIDPSSSQRFCTITEKNIDNARYQSGTDLDSIFILNQS